MHFRAMQLQLFQKQYFKHELQSLNFHVIVHSQLPMTSRTMLVPVLLFQTTHMFDGVFFFINTVHI